MGKETQSKEEEEEDLSSDGGVLHSELILYDHCIKEEEQKDWRIFDHNQKSQEPLALGLIFLLYSLPPFLGYKVNTMFRHKLGLMLYYEGVRCCCIYG